MTMMINKADLSKSPEQRLAEAKSATATHEKNLKETPGYGANMTRYRPSPAEVTEKFNKAMEGQGRQFGGNATQARAEAMPADQMDKYKQLFAGQARDVAQAALNSVGGNGMARLHKEQKTKQERSLTDRQLNGEDDEKDDLPIGPGYGMMAHLFKRAGGTAKIEERNKEKLLNGANIVTNTMDGVKTALQMIGVYSETNSGGLPFDLKDAMKVYFGKKEPNDVEKSQFTHDLQDGVNKMDKKKVRRFVNQDGSLTWEILNDDKSIMSRFTYGDYKGAKIFAQGGYSKFAELLDKAKKGLGPDDRGEFDAIRNNFGKR